MNISRKSAAIAALTAGAALAAYKPVKEIISVCIEHKMLKKQKNLFQEIIDIQDRHLSVLEKTLGIQKEIIDILDNDLLGDYPQSEAQQRPENESPFDFDIPNDDIYGE